MHYYSFKYPLFAEMLVDIEGGFPAQLKSKIQIIPSDSIWFK